MANNLSTFRAGLTNFGDQVFESYGKGLKKVARQIITDVIDNTPVNVRDETHAGHAKANWQVGVNSVPSGEIEGTDKEGSKTTSTCLAQLSKSRAGDVITLTNNVPYIQALEEGHSTQAPAGMVAVAVARARMT